MEEEKFISGYCRVLDCSRMVEVILEAILGPVQAMAKCHMQQHKVLQIVEFQNLDVTQLEATTLMECGFLQFMMQMVTMLAA